MSFLFGMLHKVSKNFFPRWTLENLPKSFIEFNCGIIETLTLNESLTVQQIKYSLQIVFILIASNHFRLLIDIATYSDNNIRKWHLLVIIWRRTDRIKGINMCRAVYEKSGIHKLMFQKPSSLEKLL